MQFLRDLPNVETEALKLLNKFELQVRKLRKSDVESFRRKIHESSDLKSKSQIVRNLLEQNVPASIKLLEWLLQKRNNDKLTHLEWMSHRVQAAMSAESFNSARAMAESAHSFAKSAVEELEETTTDAIRKATFQAYIKTCVDLLLVCRYQGKMADAETYLHEAKAVADVDGDKDDRHLIRILEGDLLLARGQLNKAIETIFTPLRVKSNISLRNRGILLQKLGNACRSAAQWGLAKDYLRESIKIAQDLEDQIAEFDRVTDLGNVYRSEGRIADALEQQVPHMAFAFKRGDLWGITIACFNMGFAYYSITPNPDLKRALVLLSLKHDLAAQAKNEPLRGMALNNLGKTFCALGEYEAALRVMHQSVEVARITENIAGVGMAYGNIGTAYRSLGKHDEAIEYHTKYFENALGRGDDGGAAIMLRELAIDYVCKGDFCAAELKAREAISTLETIRNKLGEEDASKIANFDKNQSEIYSLLQVDGNLKMVAESLTKTMDFVKTNDRFGYCHRKYISMPSFRAVIGQEVILCKQGKHAEALAISELARSRALTDLIRDKLVQSIVAGRSWIFASDFVSKWQNFTHDILYDYYKAADELETNFVVYSVVKDYDSNGADQQLLYIWVVLNEKSARGKKERVHFKSLQLSQSVQDELHVDSGFFASLTRSFKKLSLGENPLELINEKEKTVKSEIATDAVLVEIPEDPDVKEFLSLLKSMFPTETEQNSLQKDKEILQPGDLAEVEDSREIKSTNDGHAEDRAEIATKRLMYCGSWENEGLKQLLQLYEVCIAPINDYLPNSTNIHTVPCLTIVPHEFLYSIPFCCLHNGNNEYFVERFVISYAPSLRALLLLNQRLDHLKSKQGNRKLEVLAMGNPTMALPGIRDLPNSEYEAKHVQEVFGEDLCQIALRWDATKRLFVSELKNKDILHLATHACPQDITIEEEPSQGNYSMSGCLLLASSDKDCEGVVKATDIIAEDCICQLVTLSCCETGLGKVTGDGVIGLYRAFFAAGAASVLVTLWKIRDDVTPIFMEHFYNEFKASGNVPGSLRSAMLYCIRDRKLPPQQWAAFSHIGAISRLIDHQE